ncbi:MFS transporter small subunit [Mycobacterium sp. URHB0021]
MSEQGSTTADSAAGSSSRNIILGAVGCIWVGVPFCYGLVQLVLKIPGLFSG